MSGLDDSREAVKMSTNSGIVIPHLQPLPRPRLAPQQSNSVPSTPRQHPRDFAFNVRTPSPAGQEGRATPHSAVSESVRAVPPVREPTTKTCRFQSTQTSRRRMPYTIGTEPLEKESDSLKTTLSPAEEQKLDRDIRCLYERLLPSSDSETKRAQVVNKLQTILSTAFPELSVQVAVFGSSGNLLFTSRSDVDVCVTMNDFLMTCTLADLLAKSGMQKVTCVHAKTVPIVKIWDPELDLACDLNVNNQVAVKNTRLVKTYIQLDERVRSLAMIVKHWTKKRVINEASGGALSSYTWTLLLINFLQTRNPPVLPVIPLVDATGLARNDFVEDLETFRGFGAANKESVAGLLFQFFRHYGHEFDYETSVVSVRAGRILTKVEKRWHLATGTNMLCVEEPFNTERNLANTADDTAFRGLHLEIRQAFSHLTDGDDIDSSMCEQFEFPEGVTTRPIFERPTPQPKPILSRSQSQSGRSSTRVSISTPRSRFQSTQRNGPNNRRASNPPAFNANPHAALQNAQYSHVPVDYHFRPSTQHLRAQTELDQLNQMSQQLSNEVQTLRAQQLMISAQLHRAQGQDYSTGQARSQSSGSRQHVLPILQNYRGSTLGSMEEPSAMPSSQHLQTHASAYDSPLSASTHANSPGTDTNPSSPLLGPSVPLRRQYQRLPATAVPTTSTRSQSQPPRSLPQPYALPRGQYNTIPTMPQLQIPGTVQQHNLIGPFIGPYGTYYLPFVEPVAREYLGYGYGSGSQYVNAYTENSPASIDALDQTSQTSATPQNLASSLPDSWLKTQQDEAISTAKDGFSRSEPSSSQHVVSLASVSNGLRNGDSNGVVLTNSSPHRRRFTDVPYRQDHVLQTPGANITIGNAYQSNPVQGVPGNVSTQRSPSNSSGQPAAHAISPLGVPKTPLTNGIPAATSPEPLRILVPTLPSTSPVRSEDSAESSTTLPSHGILQRGSSEALRTSPSPIDLVAPANGISGTAASASEVPATAYLSPVAETNTPADSPVVARNTNQVKQDENVKPVAKPTSAVLLNGTPVGAPAPAAVAPAKSTSTLPSILPNHSITPAPRPKSAVMTNGDTHPASSSTPQLSQPDPVVTSAPLPNTQPPRPNPAQTANPWQQATGRKGRKGKTLSIDKTSKGEPLPANEAERKGG